MLILQRHLKQYQEIPSTRGEQQKHLNDNDNDKNNVRYNERRERESSKVRRRDDLLL